MPVFRVSAVRTEYHLIETYIRAADEEAAEETFDALLWDEGDALYWDQQLDSSETEITEISRSDGPHETLPVGFGNRTICARCGETVLLSGDRGWVHGSAGPLGDGVGL